MDWKLHMRMATAVSTAGGLRNSLQFIRCDRIDHAIAILEAELDAMVVELGLLAAEVADEDKELVLNELIAVREYRLPNNLGPAADRVLAESQALQRLQDLRLKAQKILDDLG